MNKKKYDPLHHLVVVVIRYSLKQLLTFKHITHPIECTPKGYIMPQQQQQK